MKNYFTQKELCCKGKNCCNHTCAMDDKFMSALNELRSRVGVMKVNSGFRCNKHNDLIGGVKNSYHTKGKAVDIVPTALSLEAFRREAERLFEEVILYESFVHVAKCK